MNPAASSLADRLLHRRIIVLGDEVNDESANRLISELFVLSAEDPAADIFLYINSPGGSVSAGLAVYDVMQLVPNDVGTVAVGLAASMGQVLLCAGTPGKRFALPNANVLLHEGSAGLGGSAADVEIQASQLRSTLDRLRAIVALHTGRSAEEVVADIGRDRWFDAEAARDYGFVDHVVASLADIQVAQQRRPIGLTPAATAGVAEMAR